MYKQELPGDFAQYPVCLNLAGLKCLIIGGGAVGERKIEGLLNLGALLTVVSPKVTPKVADWAKAGQITWLERAVREADLTDAVLVICATTDRELNRRISERCRERRILVNVADDPELCTVTLPAIVRQGDLCVAISSNGKSPALAKMLKDELQPMFGEEFRLVLDLLGEIRSRVQEAQPDLSQRKQIYENLLHNTLFPALQRLPQATWQGGEHFLVVGVSYKETPVELREKLVTPPGRLPELLPELAKKLAWSGCLLLSTCNRTELYGAAEDAGAAFLRAEQVFSECAGIDMKPFLYTYDNYQAVHHLFRVACGLDSMVLGETEILGQVKAAYYAAKDSGVAGRILNKVFQEAIAVGKRMRTETGIDRKAVSVSYAAVEAAKQELRDLTGKKALVVGLGQVGALAGRYLSSAGAELTLVTRSGTKEAGFLSLQRQLAFSDTSALKAELAEADVVIACTSASQYVMTESDWKPLFTEKAKPTLLIDLAVPRDIDPKLGTIPGVKLKDIDRLMEAVEQNLCFRAEAAELIERDIEAKTDETADWLKTQSVAPTLAALKERAEQIKAQELNRALKKLNHLSERDQQIINKMAEGMADKFLQIPAIRLNQAAVEAKGHWYAKVIREVFALEQNEES